jgi:hypothetical protein
VIAVRWAVPLAAVLAAAPAAVHADCRSDLAELQPQVDKAEAGRTKELLAFDLQRARRELGEGDQAECSEAADHARKLLRGEE